YKASLKDTSELREDIAIAIVVGEFNKVHTEALEQANREFLQENGFENVDTYWVPGAFEIPGFTAKLLEAESYDLIITIGVVIRGDTPHFDYVCTEASRGIMDLTLAYETPVIFGILTCNTEAQVIERIGHGFAISGLNLLTEIIKIQE
ncbi:6,7-dimethyl-8-ribityllumazine synthase, partial [Candidatus Gracilibacteria bacterium]|nr:6,7-dimethyl-8-ribityllumazine synthase [Candidatus Gracilibacteria bacterium]